MTEWRTVFSFGGGSNRRMTPVAAAGAIPTVRPPSNFYVAPIEQLNRQLVDPPPRFSFEDGYRTPFATEPKPAEPEPKVEAATDVDPASLPPVVEAPPPKMSPDQQAEMLTQSVKNRLDRVTCNSDLDQRRRDLLAQLSEFRQALAAFLADQRAWLVSDLTAQHEQAAQNCREQEGVISELQRQLDEQMDWVRKASGQTSSCRVLLAGCDDRKPDLDRWPSRTEIGRWQAEHDRLSEELAAAQQAENDARSKSSQIHAALLAEKKKLNSLADAELLLRQRLSGEPWPDPEFGLMHAPEL